MTESTCIFRGFESLPVRSFKPDMDPTTHKHLAESWANNERHIADALDLKAGADAPPDRLEELERCQDEIEYELGLADLDARKRDSVTPP